MIHTLEQSIVAARGDPEVGRRIRVARKDETATFVVKHGGGMPLRLVLTESVALPDVRRFAITERGWRIESLSVSVDGRYFEAAQTESVVLAPSTEVVEFGTPHPNQVVIHRPKTVEFRERTGSHG